MSRAQDWIAREALRIVAGRSAEERMAWELAGMWIRRAQAHARASHG